MAIVLRTPTAGLTTAPQPSPWARAWAEYQLGVRSHTEWHRRNRRRLRYQWEAHERARRAVEHD